MLIRNSSVDVLQKAYFGGGTVDVSIPSESFHVTKQDIARRCALCWAALTSYDIEMIEEERYA